MSTPKVGLVTVLYNEKEVLKGFFKSLGKQTYKNFKLYVIDNSPDKEAFYLAQKLAEEYKIPSHFIYNNANLGVAKGNNQGIELSIQEGCEYTLLLNNDIEFDENTIESMVHHAEEHHESMIVPKIYYYGTNKLWMAGGYISKLRGVAVHRGDEEDRGQYDKVEYTGYAPTCFMLIKNDLFKDVGLMDEKYFVYYDDTDFVYRANENGYRIVYFPKATVSHKVSTSTGGESLFTLFYANRNRIYFIRKNFTKPFQIIALGSFYATKFVNLLTYSREKRAKLLEAMKGLS